MCFEGYSLSKTPVNMVGVAYLRSCLLIGSQPRLEYGTANRIHDHFEGLLDDLLVYGVDLAFVSFIDSAIDHFSYGKLDLFVVEKDTTELSDTRHCLSLGADG